MDTTAIVGGLVAAILGLATFTAWLVREMNSQAERRITEIVSQADKRVLESEKRVEDKERRIERLFGVAEQNGATASSALTIAKDNLEEIRDVKSALQRIFTVLELDSDYLQQQQYDSRDGTAPSGSSPQPPLQQAASGGRRRR